MFFVLLYFSFFLFFTFFVIFCILQDSWTIIDIVRYPPLPHAPQFLPSLIDRISYDNEEGSERVGESIASPASQSSIKHSVKVLAKRESRKRRGAHWVSWRIRLLHERGC